MRIDTGSPRALLTSLADVLAQEKVNAEEASAVRVAVQGLSPDAPLTLEMIESLDLAPGVTGALVFTWLHHKYPELVNDQLRTANSAAGVLRNLLWPGNQKVPEFAAEFHKGLTSKPDFEREIDLLALEAALSKSNEAGASLQHLAETSDRVVLELKPPKLIDELAAFFPGKTSIKLVEEDGRWEVQWSVPSKSGEPTTYFGYADSLPPAALDALERALKGASKNLALGELGREMMKLIPEMREQYRAPAHPSLRTIETFLRFALGAHRVGETEIDILNELIERMLETSRQALSGEMVQSSVLALTGSAKRGAAPEDPLQRIFGVSTRVPPPPPPEDDEPEEAAPKKARKKAGAAGDGANTSEPQPIGPKKDEFLISELKRCFTPDGPNADLIPYVSRVEEALLKMSAALATLRQRLGTRSLTVRIDGPDNTVTRGQG